MAGSIHLQRMLSHNWSYDTLLFARAAEMYIFNLVLLFGTFYAICLLSKLPRLHET